MSDSLDANKAKQSTSDLNSVKSIITSRSEVTNSRIQVKSSESNIVDDSKPDDVKSNNFDNLASIDTGSRNSEFHKPQFYGCNYDTLKHAGVYEPFILSRVKKERNLSNVVPLPPRCVGGLRDQIKRSKQCNCKKSNCLKLYCECFGNGIYCNSNCRCTRCKNNQKNSNIRNKVIQETLERNPNAFRPRLVAMVAAAASQPQHETVNNFQTSNNTKVTPPYSTSAANPKKLISAPAETSSSRLYNNTTAFPLHGKSSAIEPLINYRKTAETFQRNVTSAQTNLGVKPTHPDNYQNNRKFKGCNCKKSFCLKKYCDCFQAGIFCSPNHCRCKNCKNFQGNSEREAILIQRRNKDKSKMISATNVEFDKLQSSSALNNMANVAHNVSNRTGHMQQSFSNPYQTNVGYESFQEMQTKIHNPAVAVPTVGKLDMTLPPSAYTTPLQMGGVQISALSFDTSGWQNEGDVYDCASQKNGIARLFTNATGSNACRSVSRRLSTNEKADSIAKRKRYLSGLFKPETDLERIWREASESVDHTANALSVEVKKLLKECKNEYKNTKDYCSQNNSQAEKQANRDSGENHQNIVLGDEIIEKQVVSDEISNFHSKFVNENKKVPIKRSRVTTKSPERQHNESSAKDLTVMAQSVIREFESLLQFHQNQFNEGDLLQSRTELDHLTTCTNKNGNDTTGCDAFHQSETSISTKYDGENVKESSNTVGEDEILCQEHLFPEYGEYDESRNFNTPGPGALYSPVLEDTFLLYETARIMRIKALVLAAKRNEN